MNLVDRIQSALQPKAEAAGVDVEGVIVRESGATLSVRVLVDRDGGVGISELGDLTESFGEVVEPVVGEADWSFEVSSPGVDRPLTLPRHWRRNAGRLVEIVYTDGNAETGRIVEVSEEGVRLEPLQQRAKGVRPKAGTIKEVRLDDVRSAIIQVEFNRGAE